MTGADFIGVDIDLLADYLGGALDGTPDHARIATLISDDPAWRDAHDLLSGGMAEVSTGLHEWGAEREPMPADVFSRLETALGEIGGGAAASGPGLASVREISDAPRRRTQPRRNRARWGASLAAAAAAVAIAGVGIAYLGSGSSSSQDTSSSGAAGVAVAPELATVPSGAITSTNRNYSAESLQGSEVTPFAGGTDNAPLSAPSPRGESRSTKGSASNDGLADPLSRLRPQAALQACLDAIGSANGAGAIIVQAVDYARFAGRPALVVHFTAANGDWAWVSGPACGLTGVGPATAYSVRVG